MPGVGNAAMRARDLGLSHGDFGEDIHAANLGGYAEVGAAIFDPNDGGLTTDPAFFARGELRREDENEFDVGSLLHGGVGVEEHAIGADVTSMRGMIGSLGGADVGGDAGGDAGSGAAFGDGFHETRYFTPRRQVLPINSVVRLECRN